MDKDIRSPAVDVKSPIKKYMEKYCLRCEEKGKCGYDRMQLCMAARLVEMKNYQMNLYDKKKYFPL